MDYYGIGFSNIRLPNESNNYTYIYNSFINTFPEEVFLHEFLHSLERNLIECDYNIPALHDNEKYGYKTEKLVGLKQWYEDYMRCTIKDGKGNTIGLDPIVYSLKPVHSSDFSYSIEKEFIHEPHNIIEEIRTLLSVIGNGINRVSSVIRNA